MKKLMLVAALCVAAVVLVPVASASAATKGVCKFSGTATFTPGLFFAPTAKVTYAFTGEEGECKSEKGADLGYEEVEVSGKGNLGCEKGTEEGAGTGSLKLKGVKKAFGFKFKAVGSAVEFSTTGGVVSTGAASFAGDKEGVKKCAKNEEVKSLVFTAVAEGEF
jgi:polyisoprenoid-binding protein YceI